MNNKTTVFITFKILLLLFTFSFFTSCAEMLSELSKMKTKTLSQHVSMKSDTYSSDEKIVVDYEGLPGNKKDWITIVKADAPDNSHGEWYYTKGKKRGTATFKALPPGEYEVRVFYDWPKGSYNVEDRYAFTVIEDRASDPGTSTQSGLAWTNKDEYRQNEKISVNYNGLPGNRKDWIAIAEDNAPDDKYSQLLYTNGRRNGTFVFKGLKPGNYEVRVFFDWPDGGYTIQDSYRFTVR
jgi:hypothetical protein